MVNKSNQDGEKKLDEIETRQDTQSLDGAQSSTLDTSDTTAPLSLTYQLTKNLAGYHEDDVAANMVTMFASSLPGVSIRRIKMPGGRRAIAVIFDAEKWELRDRELRRIGE